MVRFFLAPVHQWYLFGYWTVGVYCYNAILWIDLSFTKEIPSTFIRQLLIYFGTMIIWWHYIFTVRVFLLLLLVVNVYFLDCFTREKFDLIKIYTIDHSLLYSLKKKLNTTYFCFCEIPLKKSCKLLFIGRIRNIFSSYCYYYY